MLLVIPTFNRSAKLARTIEAYARENPRFNVVILDASDDPDHQAANRALAESHTDFVERIETPDERKIVDRLVRYLETLDDEVFALGNDEDIFFPEFLDAAFAQLENDPEYVVATGRYVTSVRRLLGLSRISYWTDTFLGMNVDDADAADRVCNFQRLNMGGVPPLYWSVHRRNAFLHSSRMAQQLDHSSASELMNQITSCVLGKIWITDRPMLLRDESRLQYVPEKDRDKGELYIGEDDLDRIVALAADNWDENIVGAVRAVTSWYRPREGGGSYHARWRRRQYCRFQNTPEADDSIVLRGLQAAIKWSSTLGTLLSQFFAYLYFLKFMSLKNRGRVFRNASRNIPVNQKRKS